MIGTIGSLVQGTCHRGRWLLATSLYAAGCIGSSLLFGALLGGLGQALRHLACSTTTCSWQEVGGAILTGLFALAYACSDLGFIRLPRPSIMQAVPVTWWRQWKPYKASLAYGAALGLGITTHIWFGSFYVLCAWCLFQGNVVSGALLMGLYGFARSITLFPASWFVYGQRTKTQSRIDIILDKAEFAHQCLAVILLIFGTGIISFAVL